MPARVTDIPMQSSPPAHPFHVADLSAQGDLLLQAEYTYESLERIPFAWEVIVRCATHLWRSPDEFELNLPSTEAAELHLRWRACATGAGLLTVRSAGQVASLSLLASGIDPQADALTLDVLQTHLVRELHDTGSEPAFSLLELPQRPLLATVLLLPPASAGARLSAAIVDRCFAAAYFRYQSLI
jgi:hypothetical protein